MQEAVLVEEVKVAAAEVPLLRVFQATTTAMQQPGPRPAGSDADLHNTQLVARSIRNRLLLGAAYTSVCCSAAYALRNVLLLMFFVCVRAKQ